VLHPEKGNYAVIEATSIHVSKHQGVGVVEGRMCVWILVYLVKCIVLVVLCYRGTTYQSPLEWVKLHTPVHSPNTRDIVMLWAASCICFFGFLWVGEAVVPGDSGFEASVHLTYVWVCPGWQLGTSILCGGSFQDRPVLPQSVSLPWEDGQGIVSCTTILDCMVHRDPASGPFFTFTVGHYLTRERFVSAVKACSGYFSLSINWS